MKSAIAGYLEAVRAIMEAGITLPGDIIIAGVSGEIETGPVDEFRGCDYAGHGIGTLHMIRHGLAADCCILGEPTAFQVTPWHFGTVWVAFRTRGTMAHTAWQERAVNAIDKSMLVYNGLKQWAEDYRNRNAFEGMKPKVLVSAIRGGWPWRVSRVPVFCDIFMDVRLSPAMTVVELKAELEDWLGHLKRKNPGLVCDVEFYGTGPGTHIDRNALVVEFDLRRPSRGVRQRAAGRRRQLLLRCRAHEPLSHPDRELRLVRPAAHRRRRLRPGRRGAHVDRRSGRGSEGLCARRA